MKKFFIGIAVALVCVAAIAMNFCSNQVEAQVFTDQEVAEWFFENDTEYPIEGEYEVVVDETYQTSRGNYLTNIYAMDGDTIKGIASIDIDFYRGMMD